VDIPADSLADIPVVDIPAAAGILVDTRREEMVSVAT
jgi:hypothetical protein